MSASFDTGNERSQNETNVSSERRVIEGHTRPCEECAAVDWSLDTTRGEVTCNSCGLVVEENVLDPGAEWTQRDRGEDRSRVGAPMTYTLADRGLNTTIDVRDLNTGAASRHGISNQSRREWRRRRIIDERSKTRKSRERNLVKANQFIRDRSQLPLAFKKRSLDCIVVSPTRAMSQDARLLVLQLRVPISLHERRMYLVRFQTLQNSFPSRKKNSLD